MLTILFVIEGVILGISIAYWWTQRAVKKSNDIGDSNGNYNDFSGTPATIHEQQNNVSPKFVPPPFV